MLPDFDWSEEEQVELSDAIRDALEETDAWQHYLKEGPQTQGSHGGHFSKFPKGNPDSGMGGVEWAGYDLEWVPCPSGRYDRSGCVQEDGDWRHKVK